MAANILQSRLIPHPSDQVLLRWRWPIALFGAAFAISAELLEHQTLDAHLLAEMLLYGGVMPASVWWLLTLLAQHRSRRTALQRELEQHQHISQQLARYQDRDELARFITRFPATILPVNQVTLFQYDHLKAQLEFVVDWHAEALLRTIAPPAPIAVQTQQVRLMCRTGSPHWADNCPFVTDPADTARHYCLPLTHDKMLVGLLRLRFAQHAAPSTDQLNSLVALAPQMALALALALALPRQVSAAQQAERQQLACELHDSLAQQIGYLHLALDRLADDERLADTAWLRSELVKLRMVAGSSYVQVRNDLSLLRNWEATDLSHIIDGYLRSIEPLGSFKIDYQTHGVPSPLAPHVCQRVFSLVQESLNNVEKHAQAQQVKLDVNWLPDQLAISIADDGIGFNPGAVPIGNGTHHGLTMLRERTRDLHGQFQIESCPGAGARLIFRVPLQS